MFSSLFITKKTLLTIIIIVISFCSSTHDTHASIQDLNIYKINPDLVDKHDVIKKGTMFSLILNENISTSSNSTKNDSKFLLQNQKNTFQKIDGAIVKSKSGKRLSQMSSLQFSLSKFYLPNGQEIYISANSPIFSSIHKPHANTNSIGLARTIANLSLAASPATFGISLGISFLASGLLSAYHNGVSDFIWGGFDGVGFPVAENLFRKQPDIYLPAGTAVPFTLTQDTKISKGINKEDVEPINLTDNEAQNKINQLLKWGDLSGALEMSLKTGQEETYNEIITQISSRQN